MARASAQRSGIGDQLRQSGAGHTQIRRRIRAWPVRGYLDNGHWRWIESLAPHDGGDRHAVQPCAFDGVGEAGMAKYLASGYCRDVVEGAFRIHGGYGFSKEYEIERLHREAPMLLIGEGTADIQRMIIGCRILETYRL
ncbi:acyl-CoA dehydrogenase family protein [Phytohabitans kaempferiae]|uniref:Acyl-CoA dehydrogenase family protein n=1 Tax=Phytohabitans kaempferiae TaxID=1620943 RepID=A0ABV6MFP6_9ACTN